MIAQLCTCVICGSTFEARTGYGLCPTCINHTTLREFDRWHSAIQQAKKKNVPADLTLLQWLSVISDSHGMCIFCQLMPHYYIEPMNPYAGLTWSNIVPACRSCSYIKRTGFGVVQQRILQYLLANKDRSEDDINLEFLYEPEDGPDIIAPVETPSD